MELSGDSTPEDHFCASPVPKYVNNAGNYESQIPSLCTDFKFVEYLSHYLKSKAFYDVDLHMDHFYFSVVLSVFILFPLP